MAPAEVSGSCLQDSEEKGRSVCMRQRTHRPTESAFPFGVWASLRRFDAFALAESHAVPAPFEAAAGRFRRWPRATSGQGEAALCGKGTKGPAGECPAGPGYIFLGYEGDYSVGETARTPKRRVPVPNVS